MAQVCFTLALLLGATGAPALSAGPRMIAQTARRPLDRQGR